MEAGAPARRLERRGPVIASPSRESEYHPRHVKAVLDAGGTTQQEINDVGNGRRVAAVIDAEGNVLGFVQDA